MIYNIEIESIAEYVEERSDPKIPLFLFTYNIEILNKAGSPIQLLNRHWEITDANGLTNIVNGKGVVGLQPIISNNNSFQYTSFCPLATEFGMMNGWYEMQHENGELFKFDIPTLNLFTPSSKN